MSYPIIGWREWLSLPELGISHIKAKIDTGARTSCLHAFKIMPFTEKGAPWLSIWLHPNQQDLSEHQCYAPVKDMRTVTDSGGHRENRYVIETLLAIQDIRTPIELTLTNRDTMKFRMLLGRQALNGRFLVNPEASFLFGEPA